VRVERGGGLSPPTLSSQIVVCPDNVVNSDLGVTIILCQRIAEIVCLTLIVNGGVLVGGGGADHVVGHRGSPFG